MRIGQIITSRHLIAVMLCVAALWLPYQAMAASGAEEGCHVVKNIPYKGADGQTSSTMCLDIYTPASPAQSPLPVVLYIHGGGWRLGDKKYVANKPQWLTDAGFIMVSVNYRLSPAVKHPAHVQDVASAIAWTHANIQKHGGDPTRIFLIGHSSGAQLAALAATDESYLGAHGMHLNQIAGVVGLDVAGYDMTFMEEETTLPVKAIIKDSFGEGSQVLAEASPVHHVDSKKGIPPFFLVHVGRMQSKTASELFAEALKKSGVPVEVLAVTGESHISLNRHLGKPDNVCSKKVLAFLRAKSAETPPASESPKAKQE